MHYDDGDIYDGNWNEDTREGYGEMVFAGGLKYKGQFKCDALNGKGVLFDKDIQVIYDGMWKNSRPFPDEEQVADSNVIQPHGVEAKKQHFLEDSNNIMEEDNDDSFGEDEEYTDDEEEYTEEELEDYSEDDETEDRKNTESEEFTDMKSDSIKPQSTNDELVKQVKSTIAENQQKSQMNKSQASNNKGIKKSKSIRKKDNSAKEKSSQKSDKINLYISDEKAPLEDSIDPENMFTKFGENLDSSNK